MARYIFITGGVVSSLGKGLASAALGALLQARGADIKPLVVRLDGNNAELGRQILTDAALPLLEQVDTMDGAARRAAELAATYAKDRPLAEIFGLALDVLDALFSGKPDEVAA